MLDVLPDSNGNVLGVRATGKLDGDDYRDVLAPRVRELLEQFDTMRVLFLMDDAFRGWTLAGAWANTVFDVKYRHDFDKVAMVGAPKWEQWCVNALAKPLMRGELRTFDRDRLDEAWDWVRL